MTRTLRVRRSRGALSGVLLILLGIWGALIPFVGPYFHYAYTPDRVWTATSGRMWLEVLPGAVAVAGGVIVLLSRLRLAGVLGAWLAALAGAWFAIGNLIAAHVSAVPAVGRPVGGATMVLVEQIGYFIGLGVVIVFLAALALGRFTVVAVSDPVADSAVPLAPESDAAEVETGPAGRTATGAPPVPATTTPDLADAPTATAAPGLPRRTSMVRPVPVYRGGQGSPPEHGAESADAETTDPERSPAAGAEAARRG